MNRTSSRLLGFASLVIGGAIVLGGCGPQDLNDPDYLMQMNDAGIANAEAAAGAPEQNPADQAPQQGQQDPSAQANPQGQADEGAQPVGGAQPAGGPVGGGPVGVAAVPAVPAIPVVVLPPQFVREPDLVTPLPTITTFSGEIRPATLLVEHYREIIVPQERVNVHNIHNTLNTHHRYRQRLINVPTARTVITNSADASCTQELLPTEVVTLPIRDCGVVCGGFIGGGCGGFVGGCGGGYVPTPFYGRGAYFAGNRPIF